MSRKSQPSNAPPDNKLRTRAHIIADLSVNHVERLVLLEGHTAQREEKDYGYDLRVSTFDHGAYENGHIFLQIKAKDQVRVLQDGDTIAFTLERADLKLWEGEPMPVFLIVWDAQTEVGYWLYVQDYLRRSSQYPLPSSQASLTVRLPMSNVLTRAAVEEFRRYKNDAVQQSNLGVTHHV